MSDHLHSLDEHGLPRWVGILLRRPVRFDAGARARLMARVHAAPPPRRRAHIDGWPARRGFSSFAGLAAAAACMMLVALGSLRSSSSTSDAPGSSSVAALLYDSLNVSLGRPSHDTLGPTLLRDTLRLVRFMLVAPGVTQLALAGDFNGWRSHPMASVGDTAGTWIARVMLRPGTHRYTILAGDSAAVADSAAAVWTVTLPVERN